MIPIPLDKIGLRWRDHKSALWWLGLIHRRPTQFTEAIERLSRIASLKAALRLYLHGLIYMVLLCVLGRWAIFGLLEIPMHGTPSTTQEIINFHFTQIVIGIISGMAGGIASGIVGGTPCGIAFGIVWGIVFGIGFGTSGAIATDVTAGIGVGFGISVGVIGSSAVRSASVVSLTLLYFWRFFR